jgi:hypothetical protein
MGICKCPNCSVKLREKSRKKKDNNNKLEPDICDDRSPTSKGL